MTDFYVYVDGKLGCQDCGDFGDFAGETAEEHARLVHGDAVDFVQRSRGRRHEPDDADGVIEVSREQVLRGRARLLDGMPVSTRERLRNLDHLLGWPPVETESEAVAVLRELAELDDYLHGYGPFLDEWIVRVKSIRERARRALSAAPETRTGPSEEAETRTEWGTRWTRPDGTTEDRLWSHERDAREHADAWPDRCQLLCREITVGPWRGVPSTTGEA